jgi:hypothetical protein
MFNPAIPSPIGSNPSAQIETHEVVRSVQVPGLGPWALKQHELQWEVQSEGFQLIEHIFIITKPL